MIAELVAMAGQLKRKDNNQPFRAADFFPTLDESRRKGPRANESQEHLVVEGWQQWAMRARQVAGLPLVEIGRVA